MPNLRSLIHQFIHYVERMQPRSRKAIWIFSDAAMIIIGTIFGQVFLYDIVRLPNVYLFAFAVVTFMVYEGIAYLTHSNDRLYRYDSVENFAVLFVMVVFAGVASLLVNFAIFRLISLRFTLAQIVFSGSLIVGSRLTWKYIYLAKHSVAKKARRRRVVLLGAGQGGRLFMKYYQRNPGDLNVVGIIDRDPAKHGQRLEGVSVLGGHEDLEWIQQEYDVDEVTLAIPALAPSEYDDLLRLVNSLGMRLYKMPKVEDVIQGRFQERLMLEAVDIADLLGRHQVQLDESQLHEELFGRKVLVTGAGGSIGSEIVRQISRYQPTQIILLGRGEDSIYRIYHEMIRHHYGIDYVPVIADIQDKARLETVFRTYQPDIVYHAAAHKHVPLMEMNPKEVYKNNILGTLNVAQVVDETQTGKMVMISTDKAVNPPNVMGASKRMAEWIITAMNEVSKSTYCAVRFGNVLGSRGSVIPVFQRQIKAGGPVTVTDFRMTRYFMTIPEASRLVIYAGSQAQGGEVFILNMGEPVRILDLARKMILLMGHTEDQIQIIESGIRPGEKLYEELLTSQEHVDRQLTDQVAISKLTRRSLAEVEAMIQALAPLEGTAFKEALLAYANLQSQAKEVDSQ